MKAIFLCDGDPIVGDQIFNVFLPSVRNKIAELVDIEDRSYKSGDVIRNPEKFSAVEYIFSTWGIPKFTEEEIGKYFPALKCIFYGAGSVHSFGRPYLSRGVKIFSSWAANGIPVAEFTVAQIILANKGYFLLNRLFHDEGKSTSEKLTDTFIGNYGETVGIIGAGMIGSLVIKMLKQYNLNVLVYDPYLSEERVRELGVTRCSLETLFEKSLTVSNHLPDKESTRNIINYSLFSRMRDKAVFINTGRGAQVVEEDLVRILRERPNMTALLDVTYPKEPVKDHPFYTLRNCLLTPHMAGSHGGEIARMGEYMLDEFKAFLDGKPTKYEVTLKMLETMA